MGASNVAAAYALYASKVPPMSMVLLAYMALVSMDSDTEPWFGQGHEGLARFALGRDGSEASIKAVERAITPLRRAGAIATDRGAARRNNGPNTVRYRLNLAPNAPRKPGDVPAVDNQPAGTQRPPETVPNVPRKPGGVPANAPRKPSARPPETGGHRSTRNQKNEERGEEPHHLLTQPQDAREEIEQQHIDSPPPVDLPSYAEAHALLTRLPDFGTHLTLAEQARDPTLNAADAVRLAAHHYRTRKEAS